MAAPKGNQFWRERSSHGRKPKFATPEQLWDAAVEYFEWVDANPLYEEKVFHAGGVITRIHVAKMRAMTLKSLCGFIGIRMQTWCEYRAKEGFSYITERIYMIIYEQKFSGAAANLLNASIIARELGLGEKHLRGGNQNYNPAGKQQLSGPEIEKAMASIVEMIR